MYTVKETITLTVHPKSKVFLSDAQAAAAKDYIVPEKDKSSNAIAIDQ